MFQICFQADKSGLYRTTSVGARGHHLMNRKIVDASFRSSGMVLKSHQITLSSRSLLGS